MMAVQVGSRASPLVCVLSKVPDLFSAVLNKCQGIDIQDVEVPTQGKPLSNDAMDIIQNAEVLLADPRLIVDHHLMYNMPNLKWMQSTWTGIDSMIWNLEKNKEFPQFTLTKYSGCFGPMMAEFVFGYIIAQERNFDLMRDSQLKKEWNPLPFSNYRTLSQMSIGVLGMGDIGRCIAKLAKSFGMNVWGFVRSIPEPTSKSSFVDHYRTLDDLPDLLSHCDCICSVLPSTPATFNLLSNDMLKNCHNKKPLFFNLGRGDVMKEEDIIKALDSGWIDHAVLDVFEKEPLAVDSSLWSHPSITITPHVSAISNVHIVSDFLWKITSCI